MAFSISGLGSGIDWQVYIDNIIAADQDVMARTLGRRQAKLSATQVTTSNIQGLAESLKTIVRGFSFAKDFKTKTVSSSNSSVVTGVSTLSATNQSFQVELQRAQELHQQSSAHQGNSRLP